MASCGPPLRAAAMPAAATAAVRASAIPGGRCCCNTRCCDTHYRANITPVHEVIFWRRFPHATAAAVLIPGSTSTHMKVNVAASFGQKIPCLGLLHEVAPTVPSAGRTRARTPCCLRRRDGKECRLYTHNGTKALIRHLHKASYYIIHPRRFARNASYERTW